MFILLFSFASINSYADKFDTLEKQVQSAIDHYLQHQGKQEGITGLAVTIAYPNKDKLIKKTFVAGTRGYPPYNHEPVTPHELFESGSITKSFASAIILQLEAEGLLTINDKIGKWFPEYPNWKDVTIKQLLNMTSGIPSYTKNEKFIKLIYSNIRAQLTDKELLEFAKPNKPIVHKKEKFDYSNTNYILAGLIIEKVTKHSFAEELQKRLLDPFQLSNTYYVAGIDWKAIRKEIMARMVHGYYYDDKTKKMVDVTNSNLTWAGPAGAIVSNTQDMATWVHVLYHGFFVPAEARKKALHELENLVSMHSGQPISTVTQSDSKGFGLGVGAYYNDEEGRFWVYEGSGMGFRMMYFWRPCNDIVVVAALNNKAGEGDKNSKQGNHIIDLIESVYKNIIDTNPGLNCKN